MQPQDEIRKLERLYDRVKDFTKRHRKVTVKAIKTTADETYKNLASFLLKHESKYKESEVTEYMFKARNLITKITELINLHLSKPQHVQFKTIARCIINLLKGYKKK